MGLRAGSLAFKFALTLYLARYFSLEDIGVYGLVLGASAVMPSILGWGMNYFVSRDVVDISHLAAGRMMRDRLVVSVVSYVPVLLGLVALVRAGVITSLPVPWLVAGVLLFEGIAQDLQLALLGQRKAFIANLLFFIRSGLWIPPFVLLGLWDVKYRSVDMLFGLWLAAAALHVPLMMFFLRDWPWREALRMPVDWSWLKLRFSKCGSIYLSDICQTGVSYVDRYIILHTLGLEMVGIYTLFWSLGNAMYTLVQAALVQTALPQLVTLHRAQDHVVYWRYWVMFLLKVVGTCLGLGVLLMMLLPLVLVWSGKAGLTAYWPLLVLILMGITLRSMSDVMRHSFYSRSMDKLLPVLNMLGLVVSCAFNFLFIYTLGLWGSGVAMIVTGLAMVAMAWWFLRGLLEKDGVTWKDIRR